MTQSYDAGVKRHVGEWGIDVSTAGWFLVIATAWELVFNRLGFSVGWYRSVGVEGGLGWLVATALLSVNAVGIMALILAGAGILAVFPDRRYGPRFMRVGLMLLSPGTLPVIGVAIFLPLSVVAVRIGYLIAVGLCVLIVSMVSIQPIFRRHRRLLVVFGLTEGLAALQFLSIGAGLEATGWPEGLASQSFLFSEALFVLSPLLAVVFAVPRENLSEVLKRPHMLALAAALGVTAGAVAIAAWLDNPVYFAIVSNRLMGVHLTLPGGSALYLAALFLGTYAVGALILPSWRRPTDYRRRRMGIGLLCIWAAGLAPTKPYLFALMLVGFLELARGVAELSFEQEDEPTDAKSVEPHEKSA